MDIHEAKKLIEGGSITIVDVRAPDDYKQAHIESAISVTDINIEEFIEKANKDIPLICYCYHGISSQGAAEYFKENGFKEVISVDGGFEEWRQTYPSVSE